MLAIVPSTLVKSWSRSTALICAPSRAAWVSLRKNPKPHPRGLNCRSNEQAILVLKNLGSHALNTPSCKLILNGRLMNKLNGICTHQMTVELLRGERQGQNRALSRRRNSDGRLLQIIEIWGGKEDGRSERPAKPIPVSATAIVRCERNILPPVTPCLCQPETKRLAQHAQSPGGDENRVVVNFNLPLWFISVNFAELVVGYLAAGLRTLVERRKVESSLGVQRETQGPPKVGCANEIEPTEGRVERPGDRSAGEQLRVSFAHQVESLG
ncbi:hypothetical protein M413DRAFT_280041 [Hebeloma cylindrosporum]|uniref:Uncharacterized protein n=1 Tax=Hebeloma cylindrosporum TaxID=76867 RepID=A0A0C2XGF1_HEBCY|nr:hypothetical protein M413DRAFT_280041 [Hebeloma cylindrosporum h7]